MNKETETIGASLGSCVGKIAYTLGNDKFPSGDRAKLRRMSLEGPFPAAFYRLAFSHLPENWEYSQSSWATIVAGIAIMTPDANNTNAGLGTILADAGYSENRLERLLAAEEDVLLTLILRMARYLGAKSKRANWLEIAMLVLSKDEKAQDIRTRIARDYYRSIRARS